LTLPDLYLATTNAGKRAEFAALLAGSPFVLRTYDAYRAPDEGTTSYLDNVALKAEALRAQLRDAGIVAGVIADDSGLEVTALDGRPGVITAHYGGADLSWAQRRRVVLDELAARGNVARSARFVCYLHYIGADGRVVCSFGEVAGTIVRAERGELGFSFDPIFAWGPDGRTFAEMGTDEKNAISHRTIAVRRLLAELV
jgi:XTP/dITP diphosphohydrolase